MLESFKAFHMNAVNNFLYMLTTNFWFFLLIIGLVGTILLQMKEEVDMAVDEEQNII